MDAKITKKRLSRMLSYDWLKIIGVAAAIIFVWMLVFTTTATRIKSRQQFTVSNYMGNYSASGKLSDTLTSGYKNKVFSHEILETSMVDLASTDESTSYQLLQARTSTNEIDVMLVSTQEDAKNAYTTKNESGEEISKYRTYAEGFIGGYQYSLHRLEGEDDYFLQMANYLNGYYGGDYTNEAALDKAKVEENFRARIKKEKDKRYKKEKQIQAGIQGEIERVQKYRKALLDFQDYLAKGYVRIDKTVYLDETGADMLQDKGYFSINICPDTTTETIRNNLANIVGYYVKDENGTIVGSSAQDMQLCLFNSNGKVEDFRYEGLVYVCHLLQSAGA